MVYATLPTSLSLQLQHSGVQILCDPWLVDKLVFANQSWLASGSKPSLANPIDIEELTRDIDFILLSQSLDDHTHRPTLAQLRKDIPVAGPPDAVAIAASMGFTNTYAVDHGETVGSKLTGTL